MIRLTTKLMVADVNKTIEYYEKNLNFTFSVGIDDKEEIITETSNKSILFWAMIKNGDVELILQSENKFSEQLPEFKNHESGGTFTLYFNMKDVDIFYNKIKNKVDIVKDIYQTIYEADEFVVRDLNGYMLCFSEI